MTLLTAILTHLESSLVEKQLDYLRSLCPDSRFVVCHGGKRSEFSKLPANPSLFIEDPTLRGPHFEKSLNDTLRAIYEHYVRDAPELDLVYVVEYDHLILRGDFEKKLRALAERSNAGLFAKMASTRNDTNWPHYLSIRDDRRLDRFIESISCRDDLQTRWGCLGTGMLFRRDALSAFCSVVDLPPYYVEMFIPTTIYHLGFEVVDVDTLNDLYGAIRWLPQFDLQEVVAAKQAGRTFVHPFKPLDQLAAIDQILGPGENSSTVARSG